jgi:hypothetical protein
MRTLNIGLTQGGSRCYCRHRGVLGRSFSPERDFRRREIWHNDLAFHAPKVDVSVNG